MPTHYDTLPPNGQQNGQQNLMGGFPAFMQELLGHVGNRPAAPMNPGAVRPFRNDLQAWQQQLRQIIQQFTNQLRAQQGQGMPPGTAPPSVPQTPTPTPTASPPATSSGFPGGGGNPAIPWNRGVPTPSNWHHPAGWSPSSQTGPPWGAI